MKTGGGYAYENLSLEDLPGEQWKDIREFEGLYQVSNYGRIKSLARERQSRWDTAIQLPERIKRLHLGIRKNKLLGANLYTLVVMLSKEGARFNFSVGRLVFAAFVKPFDLNDHSIYIGLRDHDGRNLKPENLYLTNISKLKSQSHAEGRAISHLTQLSKEVTQFNADGIPLATYPSCYAAGKQMGIDNRGISDAANGRIFVFKGYFWRFGKHTQKLNLANIGRVMPELNTTLMERLGIQVSDSGHVPACVNLSLKTMKGERWKDIPGYEGYYQVSSFGRIKTLARISEGRSLPWVNSRIKMLTPGIGANHESQKASLITTLNGKEGSKKIVSVARIVYFCFCNTFDLSDPLQRIYYKDGDHSNLHYKNLILKHGIHSINK